MNKGLIFTVDAMYAMIFVVALAAALSFYYTSGPTDTIFLENLNMQTTDAAFVALYLGEDSSDFEGFASLMKNRSQEKCTKLLEYDPVMDAVPSQTEITEKKFCKGFE